MNAIESASKGEGFWLNEHNHCGVINLSYYILYNYYKVVVIDWFGIRVESNRIQYDFYLMVAFAFNW